MGWLMASRFEQGFGRAGDAILQQEVGQGPESHMAVSAGGTEVDIGPKPKMGCLCQTVRRVMAKKQESEAPLVCSRVVAIHLWIQTPFNFFLTAMARV